VGLGSVLPGHVSRAWSMRRNVKTGIFMLTMMVILSLSGYFLYYLGAKGLRDITAIVHWVIGLALPLLAWLHVHKGIKTRMGK